MHWWRGVSDHGGDVGKSLVVIQAKLLIDVIAKQTPHRLISR
jgi:hypothetical protein